MSGVCIKHAQFPICEDQLHSSLSGFLPDPEGMLVGSGKRMRHLKIRSLQEAENPTIPRLLAQAWADGLKRVEQLHRRSV